jgi:transposase-like protein
MLMSDKQRVKEEDRLKAIKLFGQGLAPSAIAERLGRRRDQITDWVTEAGLRQKGEAPRYRYDGEGGSGALIVGGKRKSGG